MGHLFNKHFGAYIKGPLPGEGKGMEGNCWVVWWDTVPEPKHSKCQSFKDGLKLFQKFIRNGMPSIPLYKGRVGELYGVMMVGRRLASRPITVTAVIHTLFHPPATPLLP